MAKQKQKEDIKTPSRITSFSSFLAMVSIVGFLSIALKSFFIADISNYEPFLLLLIIGVGFILQSNPKTLFIKNQEETVADITTFVLGIMAIIAGILSLPFLNIDHPVIYAVPGIIALVAMIFIALEAWVIKA